MPHIAVHCGALLGTTTRQKDAIDRGGIRWTRTMQHSSTLRPVPVALLVSAAIAVTLGLYYIDEGRYSLEGLFTAGNLIAMAIYLIGLVVGLFLVARLLERWRSGPLRMAVVLVLGSVVGILIGLLFIAGIGALGSLG